MAALDFPSSPTLNQIYTANGTTYRWDGTAWVGYNKTLDNVILIAMKEVRAAIAASNIDLSLGNYFSKTISATTTFTVSNVPTTGTAASFIVDLTNGGSATVNWWSGVKWAGGTAPTLTATGRDVLGFFTYDGGTTWNGFVLGADVK